YRVGAVIECLFDDCFGLIRPGYIDWRNSYNQSLSIGACPGFQSFAHVLYSFRAKTTFLQIEENEVIQRILSECFADGFAVAKIRPLRSSTAATLASCAGGLDLLQLLLELCDLLANLLRVRWSASLALRRGSLAAATALACRVRLSRQRLAF